MSNTSYAHNIPAQDPHDRWNSTLQIHGPRTIREGNIAYNDNHVNFETNVFSTTTYDATPTTPNSRPRQIPDIFFFDEPDAANFNNAYLGIFTNSGPTTRDFRAVWD